MLKEFFKKDTVFVGLVTGVGSLLLTALLLTVGLVIAGEHTPTHLSYYAGCFVPPLLIMRYYVKLQHSVTVKTLMTTIFITFIVFMFFLFKTHSLNL